MAHYVVKSQVPLTNWYMEQFIKNCGYCELLERKFNTYSSARFCEYELHIKVSRLRIFGLKHDLKKALQEGYGKKEKQWYFTIIRARK